MNNFFLVNNNLKLNVLTHKMDESKAILIHLHGLHSHFQFVYECQDEFNYRVEYFKKANILSYALEFHGHGKSDGIRGYIDNFDSLISDLSKLVEYIKYTHGDTPIFLLGESMGGAVAIKYSILHNNIKGVILLSPMCGIAEEMKPSNFTINTLLTLSNYFPKLKIVGSRTMGEACKFEEYVKARNNNIYQCQGRIKLATARECHRACLWIQENNKRFNTPFLLIQSKTDQVTSIL